MHGNILGQNPDFLCLSAGGKRMHARMTRTILLLGIVLAGCSHRQKAPVSYYPPAGEIFAGESGQLFNPDDERVPVLLGRSVQSLTEGWQAYVAGRTDLLKPLEKQGQVRWLRPGTTVRVLTVDDRLGQFFLLIQRGVHAGPSSGLLENPAGWWTDARNFRITVGGAASSGQNTHTEGESHEP
jgi:hypothetical protein